MKSAVLQQSIGNRQAQANTGVSACNVALLPLASAQKHTAEQTQLLHVGGSRCQPRSPVAPGTQETHRALQGWEESGPWSWTGVIAPGVNTQAVLQLTW